MTDYRTTFTNALESLNPAQRQAVDTLEGPVMVFAGPGTGKTQVLTLRIGNLIHSGLAEPEQILALTYTHSAAATMRTRLTSLIGPDALKVNFHTFHEFCQTVITAYPEHFPFGLRAAPLSDLERLNLLQEIIDAVPLQALRPPTAKYYYVDAITAAIENLKKENVDPDSYEALAATDAERLSGLLEEEQAKRRPSQTKINKYRQTLDRQADLALVYRRYCERLSELNRYDFADMILETVKVFHAHPEVLASYQEQFQYILADEYQDTNNSQNTILDLLTSFWGPQANIFVVGDPFQSIYRFQGANLANFFDFTRRYPDATIINLQTGYRCHNATYALAHELTLQMKSLPPAWTQETALHHCTNDPGLPALLTAASSRESELINIFTRIQKLLDSGVPPEQIAIIYRKNREADLIMSLASAYGIPFEIEGGIDVLTTDLGTQILRLLQFFHHVSEDRHADALLYELLWWSVFGLDTLALVRFNRLCLQEKVSLSDVLFDADHPVWDKLLATGLPQKVVSPFRDLGSKLLTLARSAHTLTPADFFSALLTQLGILAWCRQQPEKISLLLQLYTFATQIRDWQTARSSLTLGTVIHDFQVMIQNDLDLTIQDLNVRQGAISLTTAHRAKGREWQYVFIYGFNRGVWDHVRGRLRLPLPPGIVQPDPVDEKLQSSEEEKRLVYVALTRAKVQNFISWHETETVDNTTKTRAPADLVTSLLIPSVQTGLVQEAPELLTADALEETLSRLLAPTPTRDWDAATRQFLAERVGELTLSATMLNDYLADTDRFIERHLLHAPQFDDSVSLYFGTSIHLALQRALAPLLSGGALLPLEEVESIFTTDFARRDLGERDREVWLDLGLQALRAYHAQLTYQPVIPLGIEKTFGASPHLLLGDVPLTGKIDRIDDLGDEHAVVIDYKTGRHQTMGQLLGQTASCNLSPRERLLPESIRSPYKRQLLFYRLLCDLDVSFRHQITAGALHFVRLENDHNLVRTFDLPDDELEQLVSLIHQVWSEIQSLDFLEHPASSFVE